ncbi:MAG: 50S ribosomal protein L18 [Nanoarchaeota archaeon]|nr:50S ribosomal protein L18 [Nanoarchaeota archaeon]
MVQNKLFTANYRRKREGRTNYRNRLSLLKSKQLRLVVRRSNKNMLVQLVKYGVDGDQVMATFTTNHLKAFGWDTNTGNIPSAYLTGLLLGTKMKGEKAILDLGLQRPMKGGRIFAALKGAIDGGLEVTFSEEIVPSPERLSGKHIADYAKSLKDVTSRFSAYAKSQKDPTKFTEHFESTKKKIIGQ